MFDWLTNTDRPLFLSIPPRRPRCAWFSAEQQFVPHNSPISTHYTDQLHFRTGQHHKQHHITAMHALTIRAQTHPQNANQSDKWTEIVQLVRNPETTSTAQLINNRNVGQLANCLTPIYNICGWSIFSTRQVGEYTFDFHRADHQQNNRTIQYHHGELAIRLSEQFIYTHSCQFNLATIRSD